ncbi:MAG: hypothetical protein AAGF89_03560 [Bacteroidota bacterium]
MRTTFFFLLFMSLFLISSCGGDDDSPPILITSEDIVGTWNLTGMDIDAKLSLTEMGQTESAPAVAFITNSSVMMTFNNDGTWSSTGMVLINTTYEESDMETTELANGIGSGTYTITNGMLSIAGIDPENETGVTAPVPYSIVSFQPNVELILNGNAMESTEFSGATFSVDLKQTITLER